MQRHGDDLNQVSLSFLAKNNDQQQKFHRSQSKAGVGGEEPSAGRPVVFKVCSLESWGPEIFLGTHEVKTLSVTLKHSPPFTLG